MPYVLYIKPSAEKEAERIPKHAKNRLRNHIEALRHDPRPSGVKKLKGREEIYRIRIGSYRVLYIIDDRAKAIRILSVLDRKEAYR